MLTQSALSSSKDMVLLPINVSRERIPENIGYILWTVQILLN
jgi:hypothetical protein